MNYNFFLVVQAADLPVEQGLPYDDASGARVQFFPVNVHLP